VWISSGSVRQSIGLPQTPYNKHRACTLTASVSAKEGYATLSSDGKVFMFGCYDVPVGQPLNSTANRVIARIFPNGTFDTSLYFNDSYQPPNIFSSVASLDGVSGFWTTGGPQLSMIPASPGFSQANVGATNGLHFVTAGTPGASTPLYYAYALNSLTLFGGTIYGTKNVLCCPGGNAPYTFGSFGNSSIPPGTSLRTPNFASFNVGGYGGGQAVFQSATIIWLVQNGQVYGGAGPYAGYLYQLTPSLTTINSWTPTQYALPSSVIGMRAMTGTLGADGVTFMLYCIDEPNPSNTFGGSTIWMFNTVYLTWSTFTVSLQRVITTSYLACLLRVSCLCSPSCNL
jgi:hypothetical protein